MWDKWYGLRSFKGKPIIGGICSLEEQYKHKWRSPKYYGTRDAKHFSRWKTVINCIVELSKREGDVKGTLERMDTFFQDKGRRKGRSSVANFVDKLKELGYFNPVARRKRKSLPSHG